MLQPGVMVRGSHITAAVLAACFAAGMSGSASAVQAEAGLHGHDAGLVGAMTTLRAQRTTARTPPRRAAGAWRRFRAAYPQTSWIAHWDAETGVAHRVWGQGIDAPQTVRSADAARAFSEAMLAAHLDLLAPGAAPGDFKLVSNRTERGLRVVAFHQYHGGLRVLGGQVSFRFKADRLFTMASTALPFVVAKVPASSVDREATQAEARAWIERELNTIGVVRGFEGPFILPLVAPGGRPRYRVVMRTEVATRAPVSRWDVYVDVASGAPVAREQTLRFATGTLLYDVPVRRPGAQRYDAPASEADVQVDGINQSASRDGVLTFGPNSVSVLATTVGSRVNVNNQTGPDATTTLSLSDGGTARWDLSDDEQGDAQLTTYIHTNIAKDFAEVWAPDLGWVAQQLPVNVNINDACNAFYDGQSINFYLANGQCNNTGRLADVVYHEFGHGFHRESVQIGSGAFEGALSEGASDFYAALITGDSGMGRGFFYSNQPLREINPANGEARWPDDLVGAVHQDGLIIGGTLWDLRQLLVDKLGETAGVATSAELFAQALRNADDIPSMYTETLAADDDDGNLANGTPNVCEISAAFGAHGLRDFNVAVDQELSGQTSAEGYRIRLSIEGLFEQCASDSTEGATIQWRPELPNATLSSVPMAELPAQPNQYEGFIPEQEPGTVVRYQVRLETTAQGTQVFPDNPADDQYQLFAGEVVELYCTDFETDPEAEGWTHGLSAGEPTDGADDWQWGAPAGASGSGDPSEAYSGQFVWGNDLGGVIDGQPFNGRYQADKVNFSLSPVIDTQGYDNVRLQYRRWLNVEDGAYDRSRIYANDEVVWENFGSPGQPDAATSVNHTDREWRFHDVDLSDAVRDDTVQIRFELDTDPGFETGGWTIDDFCVVAFERAAPPICGNAALEAGEECDDGNVDAGDGCSPTCTLEDDDGGSGGNGADDDDDVTPFSPDVSSGCGCFVAGGGPDREDDDSGETGWALLALGLVGALSRRRRTAAGVRREHGHRARRRG